MGVLTAHVVFSKSRQDEILRELRLEIPLLSSIGLIELSELGSDHLVSCQDPGAADSSCAALYVCTLYILGYSG